MLIYKKGDILEAEEDVICHQVNVDGVMGGGLARQIANKYPGVEKEYKDFCNTMKNNYTYLRGSAKTIICDDGKMIANCFTQKPNFDTDYQAIKECFDFIINLFKTCKKSICIPKNYGCGIANGDWNIVSKIFEDLSNKYGIDIVVYQLEEGV